MSVQHRLNWISPSISQKEIEVLFHWMNNHLKLNGAMPLTHFSKLTLQPVLKPDIALNIQFPLFFAEPESAETLRKLLWKEVLEGSLPVPRPHAIAILPEAVLDTKKKLVVFDMDSTLINEEVIDEMARKMGIYEEVARITEEAMRGELSFIDSLLARCRLLTGMSIHQAMNIIPELTLSPGAEELLTSLRTQGIKTAIVSGGFQFILRHFQKQCFIDHVYGNELDLDEQDQFTGDVLFPIVDAQYKQKLVSNLKTQYGIPTENIVVVGDGANDLLMMQEAGTKISFCGKPKLSQETNTLVLDRNLLWILPLL